MHLVVARFAEDLRWLSDETLAGIFEKITVYNKGCLAPHIPDGLSCEVDVHKLPNVGRDPHTILHHIIDEYDSLAPVTVFTLGSCHSNPQKWVKFKRVVDKALHTGSSAFPTEPWGALHPVHHPSNMGNFHLEENQATDAANRAENPEAALAPCAHRPFRAWYESHNLPDVYAYGYNCIFAVSRDDVHQHPRSHYESFIKELEHHSNPEVMHYIERAWLAIFHKVPDGALEK